MAIPTLRAGRWPRRPRLSVSPTGGAAGGGAAGICANETLADSLSRAVEGGASVVLATGRFTGTVRSADGEIAVPYSEVVLTDASTLAGPELPAAGSAWVYGDLAAAGPASATGETSSLWARGGRLVAVVDPASDWSGLPGPVIRVAPVVGDDVVMGWVGCWSTQGVPSGTSTARSTFSTTAAGTRPRRSCPRSPSTTSGRRCRPAESDGAWAGRDRGASGQAAVDPAVSRSSSSPSSSGVDAVQGPCGARRGCRSPR